MAKMKNIFAASVLAGTILAPIQKASAIDYSGSINPVTIDTTQEITLNSATIDASNQIKTAGIEIQPGTTLTLNLQGDNYIYGGACAAGIHVSPKYNGTEYNASESAKLIIKGSGNLTVIGGRGGVKNSDTFQCGTGAGIGGNGSYAEWDGYGEISDGTWDWSYGPDFGEITIANDFTGTLESHSGLTDGTMDHFDNQNSFAAGAGIGGGGTIAENTSPVWHEVLNGKININGGNIVASGTTDGDSDRIGGGAGIGSGSGRGDGGISFSNIEINITNGNITATGGYLGAGIGGGSNQNSGNINISGGTIVAHYGPIEEGFPSPSGAGIGAGDCGSIQTINITGGNITATGLGSAGIGGGYEATQVAKAIYDGYDGYNRTTANLTGTINISGENTKVVAIGESILDDEDYPRIKSGAGIGSGAPYQYSDEWQPVYYAINITDHADVTAIGGEYGNAIGTGGTRKGDNIIREYGAAVTIDDTVKLFASNNSDNQTIPVIPEENDYDDFRGITPITFVSTSKYLVLHDGTYTDAYSNLPASWDGKGADYEISNGEMTVTVEDNDSTTHALPANYIANRNFAVISGSEPAQYCTITLRHIDATTNQSIIDNETTAENAVCGEAELEIKASEAVLAQNYKVESAKNAANETIDIPFTATNTEDGMIYTIFYTPVESTPEDTSEDTSEDTPDQTDNVNTIDEITKYSSIFTFVGLGLLVSIKFIRKHVRN